MSTHLPGFESFSGFFRIMMCGPNQPPAAKGFKPVLSRVARNQTYRLDKKNTIENNSLINLWKPFEAGAHAGLLVMFFVVFFSLKIHL